jgi:hypothetical protein
MTIKIEITRNDESEGKAFVSVVNADGFGNTYVAAGGVHELPNGVTKEFYVHQSQELRIHEVPE